MSSRLWGESERGIKMDSINYRIDFKLEIEAKRKITMLNLELANRGNLRREALEEIELDSVAVEKFVLDKLKLLKSAAIGADLIELASLLDDFQNALVPGIEFKKSA